MRLSTRLQSYLHRSCFRWTVRGPFHAHRCHQSDRGGFHNEPLWGWHTPSLRSQQSGSYGCCSSQSNPTKTRSNTELVRKEASCMERVWTITQVCFVILQRGANWRVWNQIFRKETQQLTVRSFYILPCRDQTWRRRRLCHDGCDSFWWLGCRGSSPKSPQERCLKSHCPRKCPKQQHEYTLVNIRTENKIKMLPNNVACIPEAIFSTERLICWDFYVIGQFF